MDARGPRERPGERRGFLAGIASVGRSSVLGPLVAACVACKDEEDLAFLARTDPREFSATQRRSLAAAIDARFPVFIDALPAEVLNRRLVQEPLHEIEARLFASLASRASPSVLTLEARAGDETALAVSVSRLWGMPAVVVARRNASASAPLVQAAHLVAAARREAEIGRIESEFGVRIGTGEGNDPATRRFLRTWALRAEVPPHAREGWRSLAEAPAEPALDTP